MTLSTTEHALTGTSAEATYFEEIGSGLDGVDFASLAASGLKNKPATFEEAVVVARSIGNRYFVHEDYSYLAGRVLLAANREEMPPTFSAAIRMLSGTLDPAFSRFVERNARALDAMVDASRDERFDHLGASILTGMYLMKRADGKMCETAQYMFLRVAAFLHYPRDERVVSVIASADDTDSAQEIVRRAFAKSIHPLPFAEKDAAALKTIKQVYDDLSSGLYIHATPTILNAGRVRSQLGSCFTLSVEDNIGSLIRSWHDSALISKYSGGLGMDFSAIRHSTMTGGGATKGIVPWLRIIAEILEAIDQNTVRPGSCACYLSDWHIDIQAFVDLLLPIGDPKARAPSLFTGVVVSDELMRRAVADEEWTLFCPTASMDKPLYNLWGTDFEAQYRFLEAEYDAGRIPGKRIRARDLLRRIAASQQETGMPYMMFADSVNRKTQHQHLGKIRLSNLCSEITLFTDKDHIGSCNLASIALSSCVVTDGSARAMPGANPGERSSATSAGVPAGTPAFDFGLLERATRQLVRNLNEVIDRTFYHSSIPRIRSTNIVDRPLGVGVQDLAGTFARMELAWETPEARDLNAKIFEALYFFAVDESCRIAEENGEPCGTFAGSPLSKGRFQFDLWKEEIAEKSARATAETPYSPPQLTPRNIPDEAWNALRSRVVTHGLANIMLIALMPTATTARLTGGADGAEPVPENIYMKRMKTGAHLVINKGMMRDLRLAGMWTTEFVRKLWASNGNLGVVACPDGCDQAEFMRLRKKYKPTFDMSQAALVRMAADRGQYVCQSQSFNFWKAAPTTDDLIRYFVHAWNMGMKTSYYCRRKPAADAVNNALDAIVIPETAITKARSESALLADNSGSDDDGGSDDSTESTVTTMSSITSASVSPSFDSDYSEASIRDSTDDDEPSLPPPGGVMCTDDVCVSCQS